MFSCFAELLWHMELSNMVGCAEAGRICVTRGYAWNAMPGYLIDEDVLAVLERSNPRQVRQHDLIVGNKPPCRFEQRACLTFRRSWHHEKQSPFYSYLHTNELRTNHKEGNMEYKALSTKGLELFADHHRYIQSRGGRLAPLRDEYPNVYKMPFILEYNRWPTAARQDYDGVKVRPRRVTQDMSNRPRRRNRRHDE